MIRRHEPTLDERETAAGFEHPAFADAGADWNWLQEARFDLDGGKPLSQHCIRRDRYHRIQHGDGEAALDVAEMIAEGRLRSEFEFDESDIKTSVDDREWRKGRTDRLRLAVQQPSQFVGLVADRWHGAPLPRNDSSFAAPQTIDRTLPMLKGGPEINALTT